MELNLQFFGGRGSSSGGTGPYGGGMEGTDTNVTVRSQHPLTDEISKGGGGFANEIMDTRDAFEREYEKFRENPIVDEFLRAELALCRMMQKNNLIIMDAIRFE